MDEAIAALQLNRLGVRCPQLKGNPEIIVNPGILGIRHVAGGAHRITVFRSDGESPRKRWGHRPCRGLLRRLGRHAENKCDERDDTDCFEGWLHAGSHFARLLGGLSSPLG